MFSSSQKSCEFVWISVLRRQKIAQFSPFRTTHTLPWGPRPTRERGCGGGAERTSCMNIIHLLDPHHRQSNLVALHLGLIPTS